MRAKLRASESGRNSQNQLHPLLSIYIFHVGWDCDIFFEMRIYCVVKIHIRLEEYPKKIMCLEEYPNLSVNQLQMILTIEKRCVSE